MTWDDLTKALNNLTDDVSYITMDDDGYVTLRIGKIDTDSPIPSGILREVIGFNKTVCIDCSKEVVFEAEDGIEEWEPDPITGEKRCFSCHSKIYENGRST